MNINDDIIQQTVERLSKTKRLTKGQDLENRKYHKITISVSKKEKELIQQRSVALGLSVTEYIKSKLLLDDLDNPLK